MSNVEGKVIVVTGASSVVGAATARVLAARGATLVVGARRTERVESLVAEIAATGGAARARAVDVSRRADVRGLVAFAKAELGAVDVMVNNAGVAQLSPLAALEVDEWDYMIDVNIRGVLNGIAAVLPDMKARGSGHIVNVAPAGVYGVVPAGAVYNATRLAVWAVSEGLRRENPDIRVTTILPGAAAGAIGGDLADDGEAGPGPRRKAFLAPEAIVRAIARAIEQADDVDANEHDRAAGVGVGASRGSDLRRLPIRHRPGAEFAS